METTESTTPVTPITPSTDFKTRFDTAIADKGGDLTFIARNIHNGIATENSRTLDTVHKVIDCSNGILQDEVILKAIEDMPMGGNGY